MTAQQSHAKFNGMDQASIELARQILVDTKPADRGAAGVTMPLTPAERTHAAAGLLLNLVDRATAAACTSDTAATGGESTLGSGVLDLLAAIRDTLDVPLPGVDSADRQAYRDVLDHRRTAVHVVLDTLLIRRRPRVEPDDAEFIRQRTLDTPVTYTVYELPAKRGERS